MPKKPLIKLFATIRAFFVKISPKGIYTPDDGIHYWREKIFMRIALITFLAATLALVGMAFVTIKTRYWSVLVVDILAYLIAILAAFGKKISLKNRSYLFIGMVFIMGVALQVIGGPISNGTLLLFIFPILAAVFLGAQAAALCIGVNILVMIILGSLLQSSMLQHTGMAAYSLMDWAGVSIGFTTFSILITFSVSVLLENVVESFESKKKMEAALRESETRYRAIVEDQLELIDRWLPDGTLTFVNQACADYVNTSPEKLLGMNFFDFLSEDQQIFLKQNLKNLTPESPAITTEEIITVNGNQRWMRWTNRALFDDNGELLEYQSVGSDITDQKIVEDELAQSERRYRTIVDTQKELIDRWNPDGILTFVNASCCQYYNMSREELLGTSIVDLASDHEKQRLQDYMLTFNIEQPSQIYQTFRPDAAGNMRWVEWQDAAIFDDKGQIVEFQSVGRDITEEKRAKDELQKSEARYRAVVDDQVELISRWLPDSTLTFLNDSACRFFNKPRKELLGTSMIDLAPDREKQRLRDYIASFNADNPNQSIQITGMDKNGSLRWFEWHDRAIFDERGKIVEFQSIGRDITEEKRAKEELLISEARYRAVVEDQMELVCRMLPDTTLTFINNAYAHFFGRTTEDLTGCKLSDVASPELTRLLQAVFDQITVENPVIRSSHEEINAQGETRWFAWTDRGIFDAQGNLVEIQSIGHDIHERKLTEQALRESEARYRAIVEDQTELICRFLPDATLTFVNHAYCRFSGKSAQELLGSTVFALLLEETKPLFTEVISSLTPDHPVASAEMRRRAGSGEIRWLSWSYHGIFEGHRLIEIQAIGRDIHDRKLAEQALQESETRYRAIVEGQIEPVCRWKPDFTLNFVNDAYCNLFGKTREELLWHSFQDQVPAEDWNIVVNIAEELSQAGPHGVSINRVITPAGERWLQWAVSVIRSENGSIIEFQSVGHDISEQKETQQMLQAFLSEQIKLTEANRELVQRLEALYLTDVNRHEAQLSLLANELHDDVLNALAVVSANLDPEETPPHVIEAYEQAIYRTREIVNGLRTTMLNYGLYIGLETLADEFSDQFPKGPAFFVDVPRIDTRYDPNVELHLFRIAQEACNNAIKHANATEIHIDGILETDKVSLEIIDNGCGFTADERLDLPALLREKHFGLAGMFERAELIHAELRIDSVPQQGSRVRILWQAHNDQLSPITQAEDFYRNNP
jgi:PAS domain S-box-containing protein